MPQCAWKTSRIMIIYLLNATKKKRKTVFTIHRMIDQDNDIKLSKRNLMVAHKLLNQGLLFQVF